MNSRSRAAAPNPASVEPGVGAAHEGAAEHEDGVAGQLGGEGRLEVVELGRREARPGGVEPVLGAGGGGDDQHLFGSGLERQNADRTGREDGEKQRLRFHAG